MNAGAPGGSPWLRAALAFAIVYVVWGSTYLGIRIGMQGGLPPLIFSGTRFLAAGGIMLGIAALRGARWPADAGEWRTLSVTGLILLGAANGLVTWASQWVASNLAALVVASAALWLALFGALGPYGERVSPGGVAGLLAGFIGVGLLVGTAPPDAGVPASAWVALLLAPVLWAGGSIYARRRPVTASPMVGIGVQMFAAGLAMSLLGLGFEPLPDVAPPRRAAYAWLYLVLVGSCIGYAAYIWLVHHVTPSALGTYAYVNPLVAALLGWWWLDEWLTGSQILGSMIILLGVILVSASARRRRGRAVVRDAD